VEAGFKKDDVLVLQLPNTAELPLLRVACEKAGVICLPILRNLRTREVAEIMGRLKVRGIVLPGKYRGVDYFEMANQIKPELPSLQYIMVLDDNVPDGAISVMHILQDPLEKHHTPEVLSEKITQEKIFDQQNEFFKSTCYPPHEVSMINHTSGTTGFPKFVEYSMAARLALGRGFVNTFKLTENDVICALGSVPAGVNNVAYFAAPQAASKVVMLNHFAAETAFKIIEKEKVTVTCGVPAMYTLMVRSPVRNEYDLSSVRLWWCGSAFLPFSLGVEVEEKLGAKIVNGMGAVDFGGTTIADPDNPLEKRVLTVGKPQSGTIIKIVHDNGSEVEKGEIGEIWGTGPACSSGYYQDPETTRQTWTDDGWFRSGDLGRLDEDGNVIIVGRKKDVIIRGGQNIYPTEVETLLLTHPSVADVAVVAIPDPVMGEKACACAVLKPGMPLTFKEMESFLNNKDIAFYKIPERLEIIETMPTVGGGTKIDKKVLRKDIIDKLKKIKS
ncbi:MAG: fatty acid--CoA ligase family protein, partial [Dehalococcoidia bacterium]|nr:fatty acid--CoA ligase family protein [Dehalococcoidia bacterium]